MKDFGLFNLAFRNIWFIGLRVRVSIPTHPMRTGYLLESLLLILNSSFHPWRQPSLLLPLYNISCLTFQSESQDTGHTVPKLFQRELRSTAVCFKPLFLLWDPPAGLIFSPLDHELCWDLPPSLFLQSWKCLIPHLGSWFFNKCHLSSYLFIPRSHLSIPLLLFIAI